MKKEFPFFKAYSEGKVSESVFLADVKNFSKEIASFNISAKQVILLGHFERHMRDLNALYLDARKEAQDENTSVFYGDVVQVKKHLLAVRDLLLEMKDIIGGSDHPVVSRVIGYCKDTLTRLREMGFPEKDLSELSAAFA